MPGAALNGKWAFDHSEGMDALVAALKVPADKMPKDGNTTAEISVSGNTITITQSHATSGRSKTNVLTIGQSSPAEELSKFAGQDISATPSWDGDKLVVAGDGGKGRITREASGNQMIVTLEFGNVSAKRFFNKA